MSFQTCFGILPYKRTLSAAKIPALFKPSRVLIIEGNRPHDRMMIPWGHGKNLKFASSAAEHGEILKIREYSDLK